MLHLNKNAWSYHLRRSAWCGSSTTAAEDYQWRTVFNDADPSLCPDCRKARNAHRNRPIIAIS